MNGTIEFVDDFVSDAHRWTRISGLIVHDCVKQVTGLRTDHTLDDICIFDSILRIDGHQRSAVPDQIEFAEFSRIQLHHVADENL